ncbi:type II toxin-antitoxin system RelE/ParE family toxin [Thiorhodospira sibirica]|uniref:type II toxin-antitoxin system RelE/ParE family toxin n=1 Tax=Thiorhodospira sibirica TaxID=154347 RepID=UPI001FEA571D|nr:type II toxin-antitoxin system RelE/ParE family toxin [Thiorhodospira sibirica]
MVSGGSSAAVFTARWDVQDDAVYVLHAFQKKSQKTTKNDIDLAAKRYKLIGEAL